MASRSFAVTGLRKTGNTWIWNLATTSVEAAHSLANAPIPVRLDWVLESAAGFRQLRRKPLDAQELAWRLAGRPPRADGPFPSHETGGLRHCLKSMAGKIKLALSKRDQGEELSVEALTEALVERAMSGGPDDACQDAWFSGKHLPVDVMMKRFPDFRVLWVVRDPRDVVISALYHNVITLGTPDELKHVLGAEIPDDIRRAAKDTDSWFGRFVRVNTAQQIDFYRRTLPFRDAVTVARYEDFAQDATTATEHVLRELGLNPSASRIATSVKAYDFKALSGGEEESKHGFVRKGQPGDWRSYFSKRLVPYMADGFLSLVEELGYEPDDAWVEALPKSPQKNPDTSRATLGAAAVHTYGGLWAESRECQEKFPHVFKRGSDGSFLDWLKRSAIPEVQEWVALATALVEAWGGTEEAERGPADAFMGY